MGIISRAQESALVIARGWYNYSALDEQQLHHARADYTLGEICYDATLVKSIMAYTRLAMNRHQPYTIYAALIPMGGLLAYSI